MKGFRGGRFGVLAVAALAIGLFGCSRQDVRTATVATANGEKIEVREVREFLGIRGGLIRAADVPAKRKEDAVSRLVAGRLLAQAARQAGLATSKEFQEAVARNEQIVLITALFRKELEGVRISKGDLKDEVKALRAANKSLPEKDAEAQARPIVVDKRIKKIEDALVAKARKEIPSTVDRAVFQRIGAGEAVPEDSVVASVGNDKIRYGEISKIIESVSAGGSHGGQDLTKNPMVVEKAVDREVTGRVLAAYAKKQGAGDSPAGKAVRTEMERSILIDLYATQVVKGVSAVTDKDIKAAYAEHAQMFVRDGKKIPEAEVRDQIRAFLENDRKRSALEAHIEELRKKAKVTVDAKVLDKV